VLSGNVIPPAIKVDLTDRQAHDLEIGLEALRAKVLTRQRLGTILTQADEAVDPH
jgi:hypothetical protein